MVRRSRIGWGILALTAFLAQMTFPGGPSPATVQLTGPENGEWSAKWVRAERKPTQHPAQSGRKNIHPSSSRCSVRTRPSPAPQMTRVCAWQASSTT